MRYDGVVDSSWVGAWSEGFPDSEDGSKMRQACVASRGFCALLVAGAVAWGAPVWGLGLFEINLIPGPGLQANPDALAAFRRAAAEWEAQISNPIRVNVSADLGTFADPNII